MKIGHIAQPPPCVQLQELATCIASVECAKRHCRVAPATCSISTNEVKLCLQGQNSQDSVEATATCITDHAYQRPCVLEDQSTLRRTEIGDARDARSGHGMQGTGMWRGTGCRGRGAGDAGREGREGPGGLKCLAVNIAFIFAYICSISKQYIHVIFRALNSSWVQCCDNGL